MNGANGKPARLMGNEGEGVFLWIFCRAQGLFFFSFWVPVQCLSSHSAQCPLEKQIHKTVASIFDAAPLRLTVKWFVPLCSSDEIAE